MASKRKRKSTALTMVKAKAAPVARKHAAVPPTRPAFGLSFQPSDHGPVKSITTEADGSQHVEFHYPVK